MINVSTPKLDEYKRRITAGEEIDWKFYDELVNEQSQFKNVSNTHKRYIQEKKTANKLMDQLWAERNPGQEHTYSTGGDAEEQAMSPSQALIYERGQNLAGTTPEQLATSAARIDARSDYDPRNPWTQGGDVEDWAVDRLTGWLQTDGDDGMLKTGAKWLGDLTFGSLVRGVAGASDIVKGDFKTGEDAEWFQPGTLSEKLMNVGFGAPGLSMGVKAGVKGGKALFGGGAALAGKGTQSVRNLFGRGSRPKAGAPTAPTAPTAPGGTPRTLSSPATTTTGTGATSPRTTTTGTTTTATTAANVGKEPVKKGLWKRIPGKGWVIAGAAAGAAGLINWMMGPDGEVTGVDPVDNRKTEIDEQGRVYKVDESGQREYVKGEDGGFMQAPSTDDIKRDQDGADGADGAGDDGAAPPASGPALAQQELDEATRYLSERGRGLGSVGMKPTGTHATPEMGRKHANWLRNETLRRWEEGKTGDLDRAAKLKEYEPQMRKWAEDNPTSPLAMKMAEEGGAMGVDAWSDDEKEQFIRSPGRRASLGRDKRLQQILDEDYDIRRQRAEDPSQVVRSGAAIGQDYGGNQFKVSEDEFKTLSGLTRRGTGYVGGEDGSPVMTSESAKAFADAGGAQTGWDKTTPLQRKERGWYKKDLEQPGQPQPGQPAAHHIFRATHITSSSHGSGRSSYRAHSTSTN